MWSGFRAWLSRNRGLIAGLGFVVMAFVWLILSQREGPRARWVEPSFPAPSGQFSFDPGQTRVEFSPDGRALLIDDDDKARLRDLETGEVRSLALDEVRFGNQYRPRLSEVAWMEEGRFLVGLVEGSDRLEDISPSIHVWEVSSGREVFSAADVGDGFPDHYKFVVSDDGSTLAYLQGPPGPLSVRVWTRANGEAQPRSFPGRGEIALSSDGHFLTLYETHSDTADMVVWDVRSSERLATISPAAFDADAVAVSADGHWVAERQSDNLSLIAVPSGRKTNIEHVCPVYLPWFSQDSRLLFSQSPLILHRDGLEIWNLTVDPPTQFFEGLISYSSRDGRQMVQLDYYQDIAQKMIKVTNRVDPRNGQQTPQIEDAKVFQNEKFIPEGRDPSRGDLAGGKLAYLDKHNEASWLWNATQWLPFRFQPWTANWRRVQNVAVIDADSGRSLSSIPISDQSTNLEFKVVAEGSRLVIRFLQDVTVSGSDAPRRMEAITEVWDLKAAGSSTPVLVGLALGSFLALGLGRWYDRKRRRSRLSVSPDFLTS